MALWSPHTTHTNTSKDHKSFIISQRGIEEYQYRLQFRNAEATNNLMRSLTSSKKNHFGLLTSVLVSVPTEGLELEYMELTYGKIIEDLI